MSLTRGYDFKFSPLTVWLFLWRVATENFILAFNFSYWAATTTIMSLNWNERIRQKEWKALRVSFSLYRTLGLCTVRFGAVRFIFNKFKSVSLKAMVQPNRTEYNGNVARFGAPIFSVLPVRLIGWNRFGPKWWALT